MRNNKSCCRIILCFCVKSTPLVLQIFIAVAIVATIMVCGRYGIGPTQIQYRQQDQTKSGCSLTGFSPAVFRASAVYAATFSFTGLDAEVSISKSESSAPASSSSWEPFTMSSSSLLASFIAASFSATSNTQFYQSTTHSYLNVE